VAEWLSAGDDPLEWVTIDPASQSHITVRSMKDCAKCKMRPCTYVCPSEVYIWYDLIQKLEVRYTRCMECGACIIACPKNIEIQWPANGAGVQYGAWHS
jgi:ferredoxin like protein